MKSRVNLFPDKEAIYYYFYTPSSKDPRGYKLKKAKIKMLDGHRSGRSTGRVSCRSTELKRCSMIEMRWNKYEVSLHEHKFGGRVRKQSSELWN